MRAVNLMGLLILGIAALMLAPAVTTGQFGGKGNKGGGGFGQDPNAIFDYLAKGRQFFLIAETTQSRASLTQFAQEKNITNGQITRQQYLDFADWRAKQFASGGFGNKGPFGGGPGGRKPDALPPLPGAAPQTTLPSPDIINQLAEAEFKMRDRNADGRLTPEEMPGSLRSNMARWDKNGDSLIDLFEFKEYYMAKILEKEDKAGNKDVVTTIIEDEDLDKKPVVFRAGGKMPPGLPAWFTTLDTDNDGQVALYEWRRGGKAMDEFPNWDLNNDGFITPDEAIKQQAVIAKNSSKNSGSPSIASSSEEGSSGGRRPPGFGKGGDPNSESGERPQWKGMGPGNFGKGNGNKGFKKPGS